MKHFIKISFFVVFNALYLNAILACEFIDVDQYLFSDDDKGIRVVVYDTGMHHFKHIDYYKFELNKPMDIHYQPYNLTVSFDGNVTVPQNFNFTSCTIRTCGEVLGFDSKQCISKKTESLEGEEVFKLLPMGKTEALTEFSICYHEHEPVKKGFKTFKNNSERGQLGELATELTMLSYGYQKYPSVNGSNQGFDGVFTNDPENGDLLITESKCRAESQSAKKYFDDELTGKIF